MYTILDRNPTRPSILIVLYFCICIMYFIAFLYNRLVYFMLSHDRFSIFINF